MTEDEKITLADAKAALRDYHSKVGSVERRLEATLQTSQSKIVQVEQRLVALETHQAVETVHRNNVEGRLAGIEDTLKWLVRLILTGMIGGAVAFAMRGGFFGV